MGKNYLLIAGLFLSLLSACSFGNKVIAVPPVVPDDDLFVLPEKEIVVLQHAQEVEEEILSPQAAAAAPKKERDAEALLDSDTSLPNKPPQSVTLSKAMVGPELNSEYIRSRLSRYKGDLLAWNAVAGRGQMLAGEEPPSEWRTCIQGTRGMVAGYQRLWELSQSGRDRGQSFGAAWGLLRRDIKLLEGGCELLLKEAAAELRDSSAAVGSRNVRQMERLVGDYMVRGEYGKAIASYENILSMHPLSEIAFPLRRQYAKALIYVGRLRDASDVMRELLLSQGVLDPGKSLAVVGRKWRDVGDYADLLFVLGDERGAKELYLRLDDNIAIMERQNDWVAGQLHFLTDYGDNPEIYADYIDMLASFLSSDGRGGSQKLQQSYNEFTEKYEEFALLSGARRIMRRSEEQTRRWARERLEEVYRLLSEDDFAAAETVIAELGELPDDMAAEVEKAVARIASDRQDERLRRKVLEKEELAKRWQEAEDLLAAKEYEAAIAAFRPLINSKHQRQAESKMAQAVDALALSKRRQAANLFLQAQQTQEIADKKELLRDSRMILLDILRRYPDIELADKIRRNLTVLDRQIYNFDPDFLEELHASQAR